MFIWRGDTILAEMKRHLPDAYEAFEPLAGALGTENEHAELVKAFQGMPAYIDRLRGHGTR